MADRVVESSARDLVGFLLVQSPTKHDIICRVCNEPIDDDQYSKHVFRVYKPDGGFVDYEIRAEDIKMVIVSDVISRYDCEGGKSYLDWSSAYLDYGRA